MVLKRNRGKSLESVFQALILFFPFRTTVTHSFVAMLDTIVGNDTLHCVPRLLCELASGKMQTSKDFVFLPLNINEESLFR